MPRAANSDRDEDPQRRDAAGLHAQDLVGARRGADGQEGGRERGDRDEQRQVLVRDAQSDEEDGVEEGSARTHDVAEVGQQLDHADDRDQGDENGAEGDDEAGQQVA